MNIYELAIEKYKSFTGEKLTVWENTEKKHKVWLERDSQDGVWVYALHNNKMLKPRWKIGYLARQSSYNLNFIYKMIPEKMLQKSYHEWIARCKS